MLTNAFDVKKKFEKKNLKASFCIAPFKSIQLEPSGNVNICRHKGTEFSIGNIKEKKLSEIWNSQELMEIRNEFISGNVNVCKDEVKYRSCNLCPQLNTLLTDDFKASKYVNEPIRRLGLNLNGKCNLQCQMCHVWKLPNGLYDEFGFWSDAEKNIFPYLEEIELLSGEPFIQSDTYRLIDIMSRVNTQCLYTITTNAHWNLNTKIKNYLDKIRVKNLIISIDSINAKTYAKIRYPGNLKIVLDNLKRLEEYEEEREEKGLSKLDMRVNFLIQKDNWSEISSILDFMKDRPRLRPFLTFLYEPTQYSLLTFSEEKRISILEYYLKNLTIKEFMLSMRIINPLIDSLSTINKASMSLDIKNRLSLD